MVSYPSSFLISTPEKLCVELFKDQAKAEFTVEVFDSSKGRQPYLFDKWVFFKELQYLIDVLRTPVAKNETSVADG